MSAEPLPPYDDSPDARAARVARALTPELSALTRAIMAHLNGVDWFRALPAEERAEISQIVHDSVEHFLRWLEDPAIGSAPRSLRDGRLAGRRWAITFHQTVSVIEEVVTITDRLLPTKVGAGDADWVTAEVLRFTRDIAFRVASAYAQTAERRGAADARLQAQLIDAIVRDAAEDEILSRAAALGLDPFQPVAAFVGRCRTGETGGVVAEVVRGLERGGTRALAGTQGHRLIVVAWPALEEHAGSGTSPEVPDEHALRRRTIAVAERIRLHVDGTPVVVGPLTTGLAQAAASVAEAMAAHAAVDFYVDPPEILTSEELLVERVLAQDAAAVDQLVDLVYRPLLAAGDHVIRTVWTFFDSRSSIERAARELFVHANTVRYRLQRATDETGYNPMTPRDALTLRIAISLGRARLGSDW